MLRSFGLSDEQITWNDVSGVLDQDVFDILNNSECKYIYSHSVLQEREKTPDHYKYELKINEKEFLSKLKKHFDCARSSFEKLRFNKPIIL